MIGRTISHYRVVEKLGEGGMGIVYKATDTRLDRPVALKFLNASRLGDHDRQRRFIQEAKAASSLNHPNITSVYDIETVGDEHFMVMEFVSGKTLFQRIGRKGLPPTEVVKYLTQVADALATAHEAGIVHRDLKPSNIMITDSGVVKLLDFGVAKLTESAAAAAMAPTMTAQIALTGQGTLVGTVEYMSPEQARGESVDQRADVWAFGCVLFEALSGRIAFSGRTTSDTLARILESEPDWSALPTSTPRGLLHLVRSCLRKDPQRRLRHIDPVLLEVSDDTVNTMPVRGNRRLLAVAVLALISGAGLGWLASRDSGGKTVAGELPLVRLNTAFSSSVSQGEWNQLLLAVAPDSTSLVFVGRETPNTDRRLFLRRLDRVDAVPLAGTEGAINPFYASDGGSVGFFAGGRLKKVSLIDGVVQTLADAPSFGGAWSGDNTIVFAGPGFRRGLMRVSASGGNPQPLTKLGPGEATHRWPSLSPSGRIVVYTTSNSTGPGLEEPHIVAESLDSGQRTILPVDAVSAAFSPDGRHLLLARDGTLLAIAFDPNSLSVSGSPVPLVEGVMQASTGAAQFGAASSALTYLRGTAETRSLVWVDRQGRIEVVNDAPHRLYVHPRLSPDGTRIAVAITAPKNDIWIFDIARGTLSRLTVEGSNAYPIWTKDGAKITYVSSQQGRPPNLFWKSADGSGPEERLITSENTQVTETWAPDGKTLLFVELRPPATGWDILTLAGDGPRRVGTFIGTQFDDTTPQISPTGRFVAHGSNETGTGEVFISSYPDPSTRVQVTTGGGGQSAWRADERELYYRTGDAMMAVDVIADSKLRVGKPRVLFRGPFANIQGKNYDVTPDGQRFLMVRTDPRVAPLDVTVVLNWMEDLRARLASK